MSPERSEPAQVVVRTDYPYDMADDDTAATVQQLQLPQGGGADEILYHKGIAHVFV